MKFLYSIILFTFLTNISLSQEFRTIHVIVAHCDNENQGIVPVPAQLGDGSNPATNLYWGALYGVKSHFKRNKNWNLIKVDTNINEKIIERLIFKHTETNTYIVADAYPGHFIKNAIYNFIDAANGSINYSLIMPQSKKLKLYSKADLLVYIGHNGLMEFDYHSAVVSKNKQVQDFIILACKSKYYFSQYLSKDHVNPILWTTGLMAPEAYILEAAFEEWIKQEPKQQIELQAAQAYSNYQKCSLKAALNLFDYQW